MELVEGRSPFAPAALEELIALAEQGQDWPQAITWATQLASIKGQSQADRIAHYHCQRAEQALTRAEFDVAMKAAKQAQSHDRLGACTLAARSDSVAAGRSKSGSDALCQRS